MKDEIVYRFADVEVDRTLGCIRRGGYEVHLRQKALSVLVYLLENRDRIVTKKELFESAWLETAVTDDALVQCIKDIRRAIGDDPHGPQYVKTFPKIGYRFIGELSSAPDLNTINESRDDARPLSGRIAGYQRLRPILLFGFLVVLVLLSSSFYFSWPIPLRWQDRVALPAGDRKTVAIFAFENQSGTGDLDWLREGLAEMLVAGMSRSQNIAVLDRQRLSDISMRVNGRNGKSLADNALDIADEARVQFYTAGRFAQLGDHLRLDVMLYDAQTGRIVGVESVTVEKAEKILSEIDILSLKLSNHLIGTTENAPQMTTVMTDNLEAYRYYSLAVEKAHAFENQEAIALFEKAIELDPNFAMSYARIGYTHVMIMGNAKDSLPYLEKAFKLESRLSDKDRMNIAAWYAVANGDFRNAISAFQEIVKKYPLDTESYWRLGRLLSGEERNDEAIEVFNNGLQVDPAAKELYNGLGTSFTLQRRYPEAIAALEKYVALAPNEANAYDSLALAFGSAGDFPHALENFERALQLRPGFSIALIHLGQTRMKMGQYEAAIPVLREYQNSVSDRDKPRGYDALAYIYLRTGDMQAAKNAATEIMRINPDNVWTAYLIAIDEGQARAAAKYEAAIISNSHLVDRGTRASTRIESYQRGTIALNNNRVEEAIQFFREVLRQRSISWHFTDFEDCLGLAYMKLGRNDEALAEFDRILALSPNYPLAGFYKGEIYQRLGNTAKAREEYNAFLENWKTADQTLPEIVAAKNYVAPTIR